MPSISAEMARAVGRRSVPLKNMCSAKWAMPPMSAVSYRDPAANITKHETDWACGIGAVSTRMPFDESVSLEGGHRRHRRHAAARHVR